jgi:polyhydroxyalkanoate synthesis repressor PhaR
MLHRTTAYGKESNRELRRASRGGTDEVMTLSKPLIVKKYGNRRLYDTERSAYINLEELAELLKGTRDVQVVDARTGEDLTRTTLLQIVVEREKRNISSFPVEVLRALIVMQDTPMRKLFDLSLRYSLALMQRLDRRPGRFRAPFELPFDWKAFSPARLFESFAAFDFGEAGGVGEEWGAPSPVGQAPPVAEPEAPRATAATEPPEPPEAPEPPAAAPLAELKALKARLEELERSLGGGAR